MKKIFIINCLICCAFLTACQKNFLDRQPLDAYSESSLWSSANDAQAALNGCYNGWEDGTRVMYMDCASDNAFGQYPWEGYTMLGNMQLLTPTNTGDSRWDFTTIQRCNWFLQNVDKTPMDSTLKRRMKGEARFLRAYEYFMRAELYGGFPLVLKPVTTEQANQVAKTPKDSVLDFVLNELGAIALELPASYSGSELGHITKGAALALKARVELYQQNYTDCVADCQQIINLGVYSLFPSYPDLFRIQNEHNNEVILDVEYKENDNPLWSLGVMPPSSSGGWTSIDPTQSLVDTYEMANGKTIDDPASGYNPDNPYKNRDPRLSATIIYPGEMYNGNYYNPIDPASSDYYAPYGNSKTGYLVKKFTANLSDYNDMWNSGLDIIVIRYAEVLLTYAEAKIELGQIDQSVYNAINAVRNRAGMPSVDQTVYNNQTTLRTLVRRERRVEFAMEGLRWFDVKRWKIGSQVMNGTVWGARLGKVDPNTGNLTLTSDRIKAEDRIFDPNKNYVWPVPQKEIDIDKNLKQNTGY